MSSTIYVSSVLEICELTGCQSKHPYICKIDFNRIHEVITTPIKFSSSLYSVFFKESCVSESMKYGDDYFDFSEGSIAFSSPNRTLSLEKKLSASDGWGLFFHPDLISSFDLAVNIDLFSFFEYEVHQALLLSKNEKVIIEETVSRIVDEYSRIKDEYSNKLIVSNLELLLNYCIRFCGRQFTEMDLSHSSRLKQFNKILNDYFLFGNSRINGIPSVQHCAMQMGLSPNHLSDLLKRETGKSTQDHIHYHLIKQAKSFLLGSDMSIKEVAYALGFEHPSSFSKLFKRETGYSPFYFKNKSKKIV